MLRRKKQQKKHLRKKLLKRSQPKQVNKPPEISLEIQIGVCLCLLRVIDILKDESLDEAFNQLRITIETAIETMNPDAWQYARGLHETIGNEVKQKLLEKHGKNKR